MSVGGVVEQRPAVVPGVIELTIDGAAVSEMVGIDEELRLMLDVLISSPRESPRQGRRRVELWRRSIKLGR